jgi:hypothetical protein
LELEGFGFGFGVLTWKAKMGWNAKNVKEAKIKG